MKNAMLICAVVVLAACVPPGSMKGGGWGVAHAKKQSARQIADQSMQPAPQYFVDETVEILTEPAGARIHINDTFMGYSPLKAPVRRLWRGDPRYPMTLDTVKIEALPVAGGQCVQSGIFGQNSGRTPPQVSFNMTACPVTASPVPAQAAPAPVIQEPAAPVQAVPEPGKK